MLCYDFTKRITAEEALMDTWIKKNTENAYKDTANISKVLNNLKSFRVFLILFFRYCSQIVLCNRQYGNTW